MRFRLLPRDESFHDLFIKQTEIIHEAARELVQALHSGPAQLEDAAAKIEQLEQQADDVVRDLLTRLNKSFITPFDPEDIHDLSLRLDDVIDGIEEAAHHIVAYAVFPITPELIQLASLVEQCSAKILLAVQSLSREEDMSGSLIAVKQLEDQADRVGRRVVAELFRNEKDPIALIKYKDVYELLEATTDECARAADVLQSVMVKNS